MQFNIVSLALAALVGTASAANYTVPYASGTAAPSGSPTATGPTSTGSPITPYSGAVRHLNGISGSSLGLVIAGGVALVGSSPHIVLIQLDI
ncbi:MAG: hypothetical protein M1833_007213 [Piccolia ochrophora]|nr:MAG: hypothetical protein M1833_007213 [Piccolia ochrophora]